jgi:hypothetical protein
MTLHEAIAHATKILMSNIVVIDDAQPAGSLDIAFTIYVGDPPTMIKCEAELLQKDDGSWILEDVTIVREEP